MLIKIEYRNVFNAKSTHVRIYIYIYIYIRDIYLLPNIMNFDDEWMPEWTGAPFTNMLQL